MFDIYTFKKILFPLIAGLIYVLLMMTVLFGDGSITDIGTTLWLQIILIMMILFALPSLGQHRRKQILIISISLMCLWSLIALIFQWTVHSIFLILTHITLGVFLRERYHLIISSKKMYIRRSAHRWLDTVSLLLAITYTTTIWFAWSNINITCDHLHNNTIWLLTQYLPSQSWVHNISQRLIQRETRGKQNVGTLLGIDTLATLWTGDISWSWDIQLSLWDDEEIKSDNQTELLVWVLSYQERLINQIMENQELIDSQVCDLTLNQIKNVIQNNEVKIVGFVLMVLLLAIFMRSIMFVIGIVNFIILFILIKTWRFKKEKSKETVEHLWF